MILLALALQAQGAVPEIRLLPPDPATPACITEHAGDPAARDACLGVFDPMTMPLAELEQRVPTAHPVEMMQLGIRLFSQEGRKDDGLFWFYASQLRWRTHLTCNPPQPGGEGTLFGAMFDTAGPMFNEYAGENVDNWLATIDAVLAWDARTPERFAEAMSEECDSALEIQRQQMLELRAIISERRAELEAAAALRREQNQLSSER